MRKIIVIGITFVLFSCGTSKNDLMTNLINEKKVLEDSVKYYKGSELMFVTKAKESIKDSLVYKPLVDSSTKYWYAARLANERLKAIDFSIDSLGKMK